MSSSYVGSASGGAYGVPTITIISDGDANAAANFNAAPKKLADQAAFEATTPDGAWSTGMAWTVIANGAQTFSGGASPFYLLASGAPSGAELVGWNVPVRRGWIVTAVDFHVAQQSTTGNICYVQKITGMKTAAIAAQSSTTGPASTGQKIITVTISGGPITIDDDTALMVQWRPTHDGDAFYGFRVY